MKPQTCKILVFNEVCQLVQSGPRVNSPDLTECVPSVNRIHPGIIQPSFIGCEVSRAGQDSDRFERQGGGTIWLIPFTSQF